MVKKEPTESNSDNKDNDGGGKHVGTGGITASMQEVKDARPDFLKEENIRDANGHDPLHPDYDETSLFIPSDWW